MSGDRQYWPTARRMAELRSQGQLPYSRLAALCAATVAAGVVGVVTAHSLQEGGDLWQRTLTALESDAPPTVDLWPMILRVLVLPAAVLAAVVMIVGLLQNRFFLSFGELRFDFMRIAPRLHELNPFRALVRWGIAALLTTAILVIGLFVALWGIRGVLPLLAADLGRAGYWMQQVIPRVGVAAGGALFTCAVLGIAGAQIRFRLRHRMTKAELERELREGA